MSAYGQWGQAGPPSCPLSGEKLLRQPVTRISGHREQSTKRFLPEFGKSSGLSICSCAGYWLREIAGPFLSLGVARLEIRGQICCGAEETYCNAASKV